MVTTIDRIQIVVPDRTAAAAGFQRLLEAAVVRQDRVHALAARRTVLQLGTSEVELLEPDGAGTAADVLARTKGGLFAAGFATPDVARLRAHLAVRGVAVVAEGEQLLLAPEALGIPGLRAVVSPVGDRSPVGLVRCLYEATLLVDDTAAVTAGAASLFGLDASHFIPIHSAEYGYDGTLTLFQPDRLDRMEIVTPNDPTKTMGRFFARRGPGWYMCFAEADNVAAIRSRLLEYAPAQWTGPADTPEVDSLFIHPPALAGVMVGVSRTTFAWLWSGHPERIVPATLT